MNHFLSEKYLFPFTKNDPYVTMKGVKPKAYLGNRIREQFDVFEKSFEHSKGDQLWISQGGNRKKFLFSTSGKDG